MIKKSIFIISIILATMLCGCTSNDSQKLNDLESRVAILENKLNVSSNKTSLDESNNTSDINIGMYELKKVLDSYKWSPNFISTNKEYGCYETDDLSQLNTVSRFYSSNEKDLENINWSIYGIKGNNRGLNYYTKDSDVPNYITLSYTSLDNEIDVENTFNNAKKSGSSYKIYDDNNLCVYLYENPCYDSSNDFAEALSSNKKEPIFTIHELEVIYKNKNLIFNEYIKFDKDKYEEIKSFLVDTTKSVGIDNINDIYLELKDKKDN